MQQKAWQLGGSHLIDSLNYTYYNHSNKLLNVIDGDNNPQTTLGDFRTSALSPYATGKTSAAVDYTYDGNGNLLTDLNKDIGSQSANGIVYNHLNLPWQISFRSATGTKGTITYIYDAAGNKLKKTTLDSAGNLETVTTYIGPFQYQATVPLTGAGSGNLIDTLKFFAHSEGRVRVTTDTTGGETLASYKYDYFLKDHLGNTRMVLTDERQTDMYPAATMEYADSATENLYYSNLDSTPSTLPPGYPTDTTTNPNNYVAKISGSGSGPVIGPGIVLKVMAGDQFSIRVSSWYRLNGTVPGAPVNPLTDILSHLISGMAGVANAENPGLSVLQNNSPILSSNVLNFFQDTGTTINSSKPHAFVNWILLDNQFNYVAASSGFSQVGNDQELHKTTLTNLPLTSSGYLYIYTSNETPNVDVFFDNLQVTHTRGPLLEENHYYPFGLAIPVVSDKALKMNCDQNKYQYNQKEMQNKEFVDGAGLASYDYGARFYDMQIGKFCAQDRFASKYYFFSTYQYAANNPIKNIDVNGDTVWTSVTSTNKDGTTTTAKYYWMHDQSYEGWHDNKGNRVTSQNDFMRSLNQALAFINITKVGSGLINELTTSKFAINVESTTGGNKFSANGTNAYASQIASDPTIPGIATGTGAGGTLKWNPAGDPGGGVWTLGGGHDNNSVTNLVHELFHAQDAVEGKSWDAQFSSGKFQGLDKSEWQASYGENLYRQQLHQPLREFYNSGVDPDGNPTGGAPPRILDVKNQPIKPSWVH